MTSEAEFESPAYRQLEADFQAVLSEMGGDRQLERFRVEYEKVLRALKLSHENEKKLIKACRDLNNSIADSTIKVQSALRMSSEDNSQIKSLRQTLSNAYQMVEEFKKKEAQSKDKIRKLKEEIENLTQLVDRNSGLAIGNDSAVNELLRAKEELLREVNQLNEMQTACTQENTALREGLDRIDRARMDNEAEAKRLREELNSLKNQSENDDTTKKSIEKDLEDEKKRFEALNLQLKDRQERLQAVQAERSRTLKERGELEQQQFNERVTNEANQKKQDDMLSDLDDHKKKTAAATKETDDIREENLRIEEEIGRLSSKIDEYSSVKQARERELRESEMERRMAEQLRDEARHAASSLQQEVDQLHKQNEADNSMIESLKRERDVLMKNVMRIDENTRILDGQITMQTNDAKKLKNEIDGYKKEAAKLALIQEQLNREKERYSREKSQAYAKYNQCLEEVKLSNTLIVELQKKNIEAEAKLKQQKNLFDTVREDRNLYSKNLIESRQEIQELEKKKKIMQHQIDQFKEDIVLKDNELIKEKKRDSELSANDQELKVAIEKLKNKAEKLESGNRESEKDIQRLKYIITEVEQERLKLEKDLELVTNERDILGTQLIRRNDELDLLYEKIKIYTSTLKKGETQYNERLADITLKKTNIIELKRKVKDRTKLAESVISLKKERQQLEKEVLEEKIKVKALSEEIENAMNVHRWRKLEGTDPELYELITKIHTLQRRLIGKKDDVTTRQQQLEDLEKRYEALKKALARQPGPESQEQLGMYQKTLTEKNRQMRNMEHELAVYRAQVSEYKYEIDRLTRELSDVKQKYFSQKKKEQLVRDQLARSEGRDKPTIQRQLPPQRFTGGGFNLAV